MKKLYLLLLTATLGTACIPILQSRYLTQADIQRVSEREGGGVLARVSTRFCNSWEANVPDSLHPGHRPMRYVRVNVHWMNTPDTLYRPFGKEAIAFTKGLIRAANYDLSKNQERQMWLPNGNDTPMLPTGYRYLLSPDPNIPGDEGIYFHFDEDYCHYVHKGKNRNLYDRSLFTKYGVQLDSVLNIFIMAHHPDSVKSTTYGAYGVGVALGSAIKIAGIYNNVKDRDDYWDFRGVFNHEVGHIYGLSHAWRGDGCEDTPEHNQECFSRGQSARCDTLTSNNVMDYAAVQNAWTPCQLGRIHSRMSNPNGRGRNFLLPTWCTLKDSLSITITDTVEWQGSRDLEGHLSIAPGAQLSIRCRVSMPPGGLITIEPGGTLILDNAHLHNACGQQWEGIEVQKIGMEAGKVVYIGEPRLEDMANKIE